MGALPQDMKQLLILAMITPLVAGAASNHSKPMKETDSAPKQISQAGDIPETDWKDSLTPEQYHILRNAGTEAPNGDVYTQFTTVRFCFLQRDS